MVVNIHLGCCYKNTTDLVASADKQSNIYVCGLERVLTVTTSNQLSVLITFQWSINTQQMDTPLG